MNAIQGESILDVFEQCREVAAAYHQYQQRGRPCKEEYVEAIKKLARDVREAVAKGVPEAVTTKMMLDELPTGALKLIQK